VFPLKRTHTQTHLQIYRTFQCRCTERERELRDLACTSPGFHAFVHGRVALQSLSLHARDKRLEILASLSHQTLSSQCQVKLQNGAPPPSQEEILEYRAAIKDSLPCHEKPQEDTGRTWKDLECNHDIILRHRLNGLVGSHMYVTGGSIFSYIFMHPCSEWLKRGLFNLSCQRQTSQWFQSLSAHLHQVWGKPKVKSAAIDQPLTRQMAQEHVAKIHGLDNVKTDALLQRAEAPMWADSHAPDECTALDGAFALALAPNLGTLPSPPSHLDLRIDRPGTPGRTAGRTYPVGPVS